MPDANIPPVPIGWPLLPVPDGNGQLGYPSIDQSVRQMIRVLLQTPHKTMPNIRFSPQEVDDLIAYIRDLSNAKS